MSKKRKSSTSAQKTGDGFIGRLFAQTQLPAHVTEEQDWYLDTPDVRLTRVFTVVLILHVVAVGGILAFKMVEKASNSAPAVVADSGNAEGTSTEPAASSDSAAPASSPANAEVTTAETGETVGNNNAASSLLVDHPSAQEYQEYRVGSGESLISIARKLGVSASEIREINHLDSGGNLAVGRWIQVPKAKVESANPVAAASERPAPPSAAEPTHSAAAAVEPPTPVAPTPPVEVAAPAPVPAPPAPVPAPSLASYEVQKGDTLFGIARRFGIKHQELMAANNIDRPEHLQAGQTLKVPKP